MSKSLLYQGSVKNIYQSEGTDSLWFEFTDDYSVFDWGKMPDPIKGKGSSLAELGEWFMSELANPDRWKDLGLAAEPSFASCIPTRHHLRGREGQQLEVQRVDVPELTPNTIGGSLVYDYAYKATPRQLLPLEVIFRFGVPAGSSLLKRKDWYAFDIYEGAEFEEPLIEFSTKLESKDRMLSYQEAALILKGDAQLLERLHTATRAVAKFLQITFARRGLKLWDGKLEWALVDGELTLVDSIGPDELRVSLGDAVFSKQFLRNFYLGSDWEKAVEEGKAIAKNRGSADWKGIVINELKQEPGKLSAPYLEAAEALYADFYAIVVKGETSTRFADALAKLPK